eukprot:gene9775-13150_t
MWIPLPALIGCNVPFTILFLVAIGSMLLSFIIAEDIPSPSIISHPNTNTQNPTDKSTHKINSQIIKSSRVRNPTFNLAFIRPNSGHNTVIPCIHAIITKTIKKSETFLTTFKKDDRKEFEKDNPYTEFNSNPTSNPTSKHYACPPSSIESLRKRFGTRQTLWGEWSSVETRQFYRSQLPKALQIDGALGLTLEQRAQLASEARHALRIYARERCNLPGRLLARLYDGIRHMYVFGYWSDEGMNWTEVKEKYAREGRRFLGDSVSEEELELYIYRRVVDKACSTNEVFDRLTQPKAQTDTNFKENVNHYLEQLNDVVQSIKSNINNLKPVISTVNIAATGNKLSTTTSIGNDDIVSENLQVKSNNSPVLSSIIPSVINNNNSNRINIMEYIPALVESPLSQSPTPIAVTTQELDNMIHQQEIPHNHDNIPNRLIETIRLLKLIRINNNINNNNSNSTIPAKKTNNMYFSTAATIGTFCSTFLPNNNNDQLNSIDFHVESLLADISNIFVVPLPSMITSDAISSTCSIYGSLLLTLAPLTQ